MASSPATDNDSYMHRHRATDPSRLICSAPKAWGHLVSSSLLPSCNHTFRSTRPPGWLQRTVPEESAGALLRVRPDNDIHHFFSTSHNPVKRSLSSCKGAWEYINLIITSSLPECLIFVSTLDNGPWLQTHTPDCEMGIFSETSFFFMFRFQIHATLVSN